MSNPRKPEGKEAAKAGPSPRDGSPDGAVLAIPRGWLAAGLALLTVPWIVVLGLYMRDPAPQSDRPAAAALDSPSRKAAGGPWGQLTITPIIVSPPLEYVAADWGRPDEPYRWYFPGTTPDVLHAFLGSTGLSGDQVARLEATVRRDDRIQGLTLQPDLDLLRSLDSRVRSRLYLQLAKSRLNGDQGNSFRFFGTSTGAWLDGSLIRPETRQLVEPLIYRDGDIMHFADAEIVRSHIKDASELQRLAKTLLRQSTMLVRLSVDDPAEIPQLAQYWGRGGRATDVRPLLESVVGTDASGEIDIVHLLPSFARNRLYRYPRITTGDLNKPALANCLWTALNFFRAEPDDRFLELNPALATLRQDYHIVESDFQLGDVIALLDAEGDLFHVVVYLAGDLVFTKNGLSPVSPWTIMPLDRVKDYYRTQSDNPRLIYHRRNDF
jgi:hypothetical protein